MVVIVCADHLLEVEDCVAQVVQLFKGFRLVKVGLGEGSWWLVAPLCDICELVKVLESLL